MDELLYWFVFGPGAGYVTYRVMDIPAVIHWIDVMQRKLGVKLGVGESETKRIVSFLLSWALSVSGYGVMVFTGMETPNVNTVVSLSGISTVTSQLVHGRDLDKEH